MFGKKYYNRAGAASMKLILLNRFLHITAVTLWLGGQLFLVLVLLPAIRGATKPENMAEIVSRTGKRFSRITWLALFPIIFNHGRDKRLI